VPHATVWLLVYAAIGLLGVALYLREVDRTLGFDTLIHRPWLVRLAIGDHTIGSSYLFFEYFCIVTPIVALAMQLTGTRVHPVAWAGVAACAVATWITTDRTQFFVLVLTGYFLVIFRFGRRCSFGRLIAVTAAAGVMLVASFFVIEVWVGKWAVGVSVVDAGPPRPAIGTRAWPASPEPVRVTFVSRQAPPAAPPATPPPAPAVTPPAAESAWHARLTFLARRSTTLYLYSTGSIAALNRLVLEAPPRTYGVHTFYPLARALQRIGIIRGPLPDAVLPPRPIGMTSGPDLRFNTYTFLSYAYEDFGVAGALVYALSVGLASGAVYGLVWRRRSSPAALLALAQISVGLVLSIFVNKFNNTASWYILLASLLPFAASAFTRARRAARRT
jgi:hypothetical protein